MGAILGVVGDRGAPRVGEVLGRMLGRSPHRGDPVRLDEPGVALGIQTNDREASLGGAGPIRVAVHGDLGSRTAVERLLDDQGADDLADATLLAKAWRSIGSRVLEDLEGEAAVVVHDRDAGWFWAYRTPTFGRPLFTCVDRGRLLLAGEVRQLVAGCAEAPGVNAEAATRLALGIAGADDCVMYHGVAALSPGTLYRWRAADPASSPVEETVWAPPEPLAWSCRTRAEAVERVRAALDAVIPAAAPDGPFAVAVSGGLDSATVWATLARHGRTEPVGWPGGRPFAYGLPGTTSDPSWWAWAVFAATRADGVLLDLARVDPFSVAPEVLEPLDHLADPHLLLLDALLAAVADDGRPVVLTGEGGDELVTSSDAFLGDELRSGRVDRFLADSLRIVAARGVPGARAVAREGGRALGLLGTTGGRSATDERQSRRLATVRAIGGSAHLAGLDQLAARHRLEVRHPLLRQQFAEVVLALPERHLADLRMPKQLLRAAAADRIPAAVRNAGARSLDGLLAEPARRFAASLATDDWRLVRRGVVGKDWLAALAREAVAQGWGAGCRSLWRLWLVEQALERDHIEVGC